MSDDSYHDSYKEIIEEMQAEMQAKAQCSWCKVETDRGNLTECWTRHRFFELCPNCKQQFDEQKEAMKRPRLRVFEP
jgi:hypothetical protein